jgi:hypothetical protein
VDSRVIHSLFNFDFCLCSINASTKVDPFGLLAPMAWSDGVVPLPKASAAVLFNLPALGLTIDSDVAVVEGEPISRFGC